MGGYFRGGRLLGMLLLLLLTPFILRVVFFRWWVLIPLGVVAAICYVARIRKPFTILLILAGILVVSGFFF
jgi:hypothetical protein